MRNNRLPIMIHLLIILNLFSSITSSPLQKRAYTPLPLGTIAPQGWLLEQLILQANALSGVMATSTFPGANTVNQSLWIGGNGQPKPYGSGVTQWLPYWTNGQIPLIELLVSANVTDRLDSTFDLRQTCSWGKFNLLQGCNFPIHLSHKPPAFTHQPSTATF